MGEYVIRGGRDGYERLQLLNRVRREDTLALFDLVGVHPGARVLDLGCGGGHVTLELARLVGPEGQAIGVDMDEVKLELARDEATKQGLGNVEFRVANVKDWNEPGVYDIVYCRFLLQHLSQPLDLLDRMWAAVMPSGALVVEDTDFDGLFCDPVNEGFDFYARTYQRVLERRGGDPAIGRKLYRFFHRAGISDPRLRLAPGNNLSGESKSLALATLDATADAIVAEGLAVEDEVRSARVSLMALVDDPMAIAGGPRIFQIWSHRPSNN